ncbi:hypothetical protein MGSAQ_003340, partial [marine sediment metagenome]
GIMVYGGGDMGVELDWQKTHVNPSHESDCWYLGCLSDRGRGIRE